MALMTTKPVTGLPPRRGGPIQVNPQPFPQPEMNGLPPQMPNRFPSNPNSPEINPMAAPGVVNNAGGDTTPPSLRPPVTPPVSQNLNAFQKTIAPDRYRGAIQRKLGGPNA